MEHYLLLRIIHAATAILLLLGLLAHIFMLWKAWRGGDVVVLQRKLRNTRRFSLPLLGLLALSLPFSGWWLTHLAGWPLGATWLLGSTLLFFLLLVFGLLLAGRLRAWAALAGTPAPSRLLRFTASYVGLTLLVLVVIFALMGAKPA